MISGYLANSGSGGTHFGNLHLTYQHRWVYLTESVTHSWTSAGLHSQLGDNSTHNCLAATVARPCSCFGGQPQLPACHCSSYGPTTTGGAYASHIEDTPWALGSDGQVKFHFWGPQDISYIKPLLQDWYTMVQMNLFTKQKYSHRCRKQTMVTKGERGKDKLGDWDSHIHTI